MKLKNEEIFKAAQALAQLADKELPVKVSYWLDRLIKRLDDAYMSIEKVRVSLIQQYGKPVQKASNGFEIKPGDENWEQFVQDYNELMAEETEVSVDPVVLPIKIPQFINGQAVSIKLSVLIALEKFIEIEQ